MPVSELEEYLLRHIHLEVVFSNNFLNNLLLCFLDKRRATTGIKCYFVINPCKQFGNQLSRRYLATVFGQMYCSLSTLIDLNLAPTWDVVVSALKPCGFESISISFIKSFLLPCSSQHYSGLQVQWPFQNSSNQQIIAATDWSVTISWLLHG